MGMYDQLNSIKRAIEDKEKRKQIDLTTSEKKQEAKYILLSMLLEDIKEADIEGFNLYSDKTKDRIITTLLKRKNTPFLNSIEFTSFFLEDNYYKIVKKLQNINKEEQRPEKEKQKQLEKQTKEELQKQKLQLQIEALKQKEKDRQTKQQQALQKQLIIQQQKKQGGITRILQILLYIVIIPIGIIGGFLIECAKEAGRTGGSRR